MLLSTLFTLTLPVLAALGAEVKLKGTTVSGVDLTGLKVEFFGGKFQNLGDHHIFLRWRSLGQASLSLNRLLENSASTLLCQNPGWASLLSTRQNLASFACNKYELDWACEPTWLTTL